MNPQAILAGLLRTAFSYLTYHPKIGSYPMDMTQQVYSILRANARPYGPSAYTGGQIHVPSEDMSMRMATGLNKYAPMFALPVLLATAGIIGESDGDPTAMNPNWQDAQPHETAWMAFLHTDVGGAQVDGSTLAANPYFKGKTISEIEAIAQTPDWSMDFFCKFVHELLNTMDHYVHGLAAPGSVASDPQWIIEPQSNLLDVVPDNDFLSFALTAYNKGPQGTLHIAHTLLNGMDADKAALGSNPFAYGVNWVARYKSYVALAGPATSA